MELVHDALRESRCVTLCTMSAFPAARPYLINILVDQVATNDESCCRKVHGVASSRIGKKYGMANIFSEPVMSFVKLMINLHLIPTICICDWRFFAQGTACMY